MTDEQALKVLVDAGAALLRYWRIPNPEAPHVEAKNPEGFGDWARVARGKPGATLDECRRWLAGEDCTLADYERRVVEPHNRKYPKRPIAAPAKVLPGIGLLPASLGRLVVDVDLASKRALADMPGHERQRRSIAGHDAVRRRLGEPDGVQRSPSGGLHLYYSDDGIPKEVTDNGTWAVDDEGVKVGGEVRGSNGWVGVYDLPALAKMVQAGAGEPLEVETFKAFVNNPHRHVGSREYRHVRAGGGGAVQAACAAIRAAEAGDTYAGRNPTIVHHVAVLAKETLLDDAAAAAVLDAVGEVKPGALADTERWIGRARDWAEPSTGNTGGPASVRGADRGSDTGEVSGAGPDGGNGDIPPGAAGDDAPDDALLVLLERWQDWKETAARFRPSNPGQLKQGAPALLSSIAGHVGADTGDVDDTAATLDAMQAAVARGAGAEGIRQVLREREKAGIVAKPVDWPNKPDERDWLVSRWLPAGRIGMVTGKGESGKSRLTLQLAAVLASGGALWIPPDSGKPNVSVPIGASRTESRQPVSVVVATWEDEAEELRRRLHDMKGAGIEPAKLAGRLHHADMSGAGPLWAPAKSGTGHVSTMGALTGAGRWLRRFCEEQDEGKGARLLVIDPLAAAFACSENDRGLVRAFMSNWDNWARAANDGQGCAVLVVSHPSKDSSGNPDYHQSGSTDWHAASRFVWDMTREKVGKDDRVVKGGKPVGKDVRPEGMKLAVTKSNYLTGRKPEAWLKGSGAGWLATDEAGAAAKGAGGGFGGGR